MSVTFVPHRPPAEARRLDDIYAELRRTDLSDARRVELTKEYRSLTTAARDATASEVARALAPPKPHYIKD